MWQSSVGRAPGCGPGCRGFEFHLSLLWISSLESIRVVRSLTVNQEIVGSIPTSPAKDFNTVAATGESVSADLSMGADLKDAFNLSQPQHKKGK